MIRLRQLRLPIDHKEEALHALVCKKLRMPGLTREAWHIHQRAVDARKGKPLQFSYTVDVQLSVEEAILERLEKRSRGQISRAPDQHYHFLDQSCSSGTHRPVIIGTGPAGLFAGLLLARLGLKPILFERGKQAGPRARDVTKFWRTGAFEPESNVQFGEGGAGTFSDGKLYTQIKDRENRCRQVLRELAAHGAPEDILVNARPHIGTDRLILVLRRLRETIFDLGGEIRYESKMTDLLVEGGAVRGIRLASGDEVRADQVILAVGHSARDVFEHLAALGVPMEAKSFSIGTRIEHPQAMIDRTQYGRWAGHARLGSAAYRFVHHGRDKRSVYSFCMCPGGLVVGATSEPERLVTNGMSSYARDEANANAGFMVEVRPGDFPNSDDPLAGMRFQRELEAKAFQLGGGDYRAPAQMLGDFVKGKGTSELGDVRPSFRPGVTLTDLRECLPPFVVKALKESVPHIAKRLPGFDRHDAILTAIESRSSSPLRVTRGDDLQSTGLRGLYPAGEGAGYAGGIISAAVDGLRVAEAVAATASSPSQ